MSKMDSYYAVAMHGQLSTLSTVAVLLLRRILFDFVLGLKFVFLLFLIHYHTLKQRKIKLNAWIKLNHSVCTIG